MSEFAVTEGAMLLAARQHLRARRWQDADTLARGWLKRDPRSFIATTIRGLVCLGSERLEAARELIETAVSAGPDNAFSCLALAQLYLVQDKSAEAATALRRALALNPQETEAACLLAMLQARAGDAEGAEGLLRLALSAAPLDSIVRCALAELLMLRGQNSKAARLLDDTLATEPHEPTLWLMRAKLHVPQANFIAACDCVERALLIAPENPHYLLELARMHLLAGYFDSAADSKTEFAAAEAAVRQALVLQPRAPQLSSLLGSVLRAQGRFSEAVSSLGEVIRANPEAAAPIVEMALTQHEAGNKEAACLAAQRAVTLAPEDPATHALLVNMMMAAGRPAAAYAAQEQVDRLLRPAAHRLDAPLASPDADGNVLLFAEEDLQSAIFFARYLPMLAARGWQARLALPALSTKLFSGLAGVLDVVDIAAPNDLSSAEPLSRLPVLIGGEAQNTVWNGPYLFPDAQRVAALRSRFSARPARRIGVNLGELSDSALALSIAGLLKQAGAQAVLFGSIASAHWDDVAHELAEVAALDDAAVWIQALDGVITLSSPLAHLCGALGIPCHILLPIGCGALWGTRDATIPWYPEARLYRKTRDGDWDEAMAELAKALVCDELCQPA